MRPEFLKLPLAIAALCAATLASAERAPTRLAVVTDHRGESVAAPVRSDAHGGPAVAGVDTKPDAKHPDWMMLLAGLAVAGWIAQRRLASPLE